MTIKEAATSLKLEIRLLDYQVGTNNRSGTEVIYAHLIGLCVRNYRLICT